MKTLYTLLLAIGFGLSAHAQVVFSSDLSSWAAGLPTDWVGAKTNMSTDSISEVTAGVVYGTSAANIRNAQGSHRRFTTQSVTVMDGETYNITFWVRGQGDIRTGLYDGRSTSSGYSSYNSYESINSSTWVQVTQSVVCAHDTTDGEFILSCRDTGPGVGLDIDSVVISIGAINPPTTTSIYGIQFTTDPNGDSPLDGQLVSTGGIVTAVDSSGYFIQDNEAAWSGIYVFDNSMPARGDSVLVEGMVDEFFGLTEIVGVSSYTNVGSFGAPAPIVAPISAVNLEEWEGVLVKVENAVCTELPNNFDEWKVAQGNDTLIVNDFFYDFTPGLGTFYDVTGPMRYSFGNRSMEPRDMMDISIASSVGEVIAENLNVYPVPANNVLTLDLGEQLDVLNYNITDLMGRVVDQGTINARIARVNVSGLADGQYVLSISNAVGTQSLSIAVQH